MTPTSSARNLTIRRHSPTTIQYSITNRPLPSTIPGFIALFLADLTRLIAGCWSLLIAFVVLRQRWLAWQLSGLDSAHLAHGSNMRLEHDNGSLSSTSSMLTSGKAWSETITWVELAAALMLPLDLFASPSSAGQSSTSIQSHLSTNGSPSPPTPTTAPLLLLPLLILLSTSSMLYLTRTTTETLLVLHTLGLQTTRSTTCFPLLAAAAESLARQQRLRRSLGIGLRALSSTTRTRFIPTGEIQDVLIHEAFVGWEVRFYLAVVVRGQDGVVVVFERLLPRLAVVRTVWKGVREVLWEDRRGTMDEGGSKKKKKKGGENARSDRSNKDYATRLGS